MRLFCCRAALPSVRLHKGVFRHEEVVSTLLSGKSLAELSVTALGFSDFLLDSSPAAGLSHGEHTLIARHTDANFDDLVGP